MKNCIICKEVQPLDNFYKHKGMSDGLLNKCKSCCKNQSKKREKFLRLNNPEWVKKDRNRCRLKFHRLSKNWKQPSVEVKRKRNMNYKKNYPEKYAAHLACKNLIKGDSSNHLHHWSYNEQHYTDCIELNSECHNYVHRFIIYDQEYMMYRTIDNKLLDTKEKHLDYINQCFKDNLINKL